jgi:hypothetical protein
MLHLCFLQAEEISIKGFEGIFKALADAGPKAIHIP